MKLSARNILSGKVINITEGSVNSEIVLEVAPGVELVAIVTKTSVENLDLQVGKNAHAVIKASNIMLATD